VLKKFILITIVSLCNSAIAGNDLVDPNKNRNPWLDFVERENLQDLKTCEAVLAGHLSQRNRSNEPFEQHWERRRVLMANLPAYAWDVKSIYYQYNVPGLQFYLEHGPFQGTDMFGVKDLKRFRLIYDPSKFSVFSVIRRMFGNAPLDLTVDDIRIVGQSNFMSDEGTMLEIYLKGKNTTDDVRRDNGGMIMISRDTGQIRFWPPGTDVDGDLEGILRGSAKAIWNFATGLIGEAQNEIKKYKGEWFTDKEVVGIEDPFAGSTTPKQISGPK
jgi:hypothetical protein